MIQAQKKSTISFLKSPFVVCKKTFSTLFTTYPSLFVKIASSVCKVSESRGQYWHFFNTLCTDCTSPVWFKYFFLHFIQIRPIFYFIAHRKKEQQNYEFHYLHYLPPSAYLVTCPKTTPPGQ